MEAVEEGEVKVTMDHVDATAETRVTAAYHEAGHALIAFLHGVRHQSITVDAEGHGGFVCDRNSLSTEIETMISMAGPASAYLHHKHDRGNVPSLAESITSDDYWSDTDRRDACKGMELLPPEEHGTIMEQYWNRTLEILRSRWPIVQAVASALVENGKLTDHEIWDLIE